MATTGFAKVCLPSSQTHRFSLLSCTPCSTAGWKTRFCQQQPNAKQFPQELMEKQTPNIYNNVVSTSVKITGHVTVIHTMLCLYLWSIQDQICSKAGLPSTLCCFEAKRSSGTDNEFTVYSCLTLMSHNWDDLSCGTVEAEQTKSQDATTLGQPNAASQLAPCEPLWQVSVIWTGIISKAWLWAEHCPDNLLLSWLQGLRVELNWKEVVDRDKNNCGIQMNQIQLNPTHINFSRATSWSPLFPLVLLVSF